MASFLSKVSTKLRITEQYELVEDHGSGLLGKSYLTGTGVKSVWHRTSTIRYAAASAVVTLLPIVAFAVWTPHLISSGIHLGFVSDAIGGRLTQIQAKAIDVICSALLGPFLLVICNSLWFTCARVAAIDQNGTSQRPISLLVLVEACVTDSGAYDMYKLIRLAGSGHPRLILFGILVLCSAIAKTSISNAIAYEAYNARSHSTTAAVTSLGFAPLGVLNFSQTQRADFTLQVIGMLAGLSYQDATPLLSNGAYIGINATQKSLNSLPQDYMRLADVPGYCMTLQCYPASLEHLWINQMGGYEVSIYAQTRNNTVGLKNGTGFWGKYAGQVAVLTSAYNELYQFMAIFPRTEALLMQFTSFNNTDKPPNNSSYGPIPSEAFNMTGMGSPDNRFTGTKQIMSFQSLRCTIQREKGKHILARNPDLTWRIAGTVWEGRKEISEVLLGDWQTSLHIMAPGSFQLGIGPALAASAVQSVTSPVTDFDKFALNYLYAAGEGERIAYEVINSNVTAGQSANGQSPVIVQATISGQFYRITYIPIILFIGLLSMFFAALIPFGLLVYTWKTKAVQDWRMLDTVRLITDAVAGLEQDEALVRARSDRNAELEDWAGEYEVLYELEETKSDVQSSLKHIPHKDSLRLRTKGDRASKIDEDGTYK